MTVGEKRYGAVKGCGREGSEELTWQGEGKRLGVAGGRGRGDRHYIWKNCYGRVREKDWALLEGVAGKTVSTFGRACMAG